jgi:NAD(P)-dependent dehydrogenase (short-subunit alcohol dehydrogenase family)
MEKAKDIFGSSIDILANNAGWTANSLALDVSEEEYDSTMKSSLRVSSSPARLRRE